MKRIHCEPHETGIAFEYEGHASSVSKSVHGLLGCGRFSFCLSDCGGNPLACACGMRGPPRYGT